MKLPRGQAAANDVIREYKIRATEKGIELTLTTEEMMSLFQGSCHYCGLPPSQERRHNKKRYNGSFIYNGIDRIDNHEGYVMFNVVPCCGVCNRMKSDLSEADFIEHIAKIFNRRSEDNVRSIEQRVGDNSHRRTG